MNFSKPLRAFLCAITITGLLSGCSPLPNIPSRLRMLDEETASARKSKLEISQQVLKCFDEKNADALKSLFCERTQNLTDIDEQIRSGLALISGKTTSFDEHILGLGYEGSHTSNGRITELERSWDIGAIETDENQKFEISVDMYNIYEKDTTREGITRLVITLEDEIEFTIGYKWPSYYTDGRDLSSKIVTAFSDDNFDGLKRLFCQQSQEISDIDEQIETALLFFDGAAIRGRPNPDSREYNGTRDYHPIVSDSEIVENNKPIHTSITVQIENIETFAGRTYEIEYDSYLLCRDNWKLEGISQMIIRCDDGTEVVIGDRVE